MHVLCPHLRVFRVPTVALTPEILRLGKIVGLGFVMEPRIDHDPFTNPRCGNATPHLDDPADDIAALDERETDSVAAPGISICADRFKTGSATGPSDAGGDGLAVPGRASVDIGVVHAAGADLDQHFTRTWDRHRHVIAIVEFVDATMPGQENCSHGARNAHGSLLNFRVSSG